MKGELRQFATADDLRRGAALTIVELLNAALAKHHRATLVLSGGSTPKSVYALLAEEPLRSNVDWGRVHFFWGDERCVPPEHRESNFRMANEALLKKLALPLHNVHRIQCERGPAEAAQLYSDEIRDFFGLDEHAFPRFDVTLLGMGEDGHTASLFPDTSILNEMRVAAAHVFVPKLGAHRVSMTLPTLNNSAVVLFIISGREKAQMLREVFRGAPDRFPVQRIEPVNGQMLWLVDAAAAAQLEPSPTLHAP